MYIHIYTAVKLYERLWFNLKQTSTLITHDSNILIIMIRVIIVLIIIIIIIVMMRNNNSNNKSVIYKSAMAGNELWMPLCIRWQSYHEWISLTNNSPLEIIAYSRRKRHNKRMMSTAIFNRYKPSCVGKWRQDCRSFVTDYSVRLRRF